MTKSYIWTAYAVSGPELDDVQGVWAESLDQLMVENLGSHPVIRLEEVDEVDGHNRTLATIGTDGMLRPARDLGDAIRDIPRAALAEASSRQHQLKLEWH